MTSHRVAPLACLLVLEASAAAAQVMQPPARSARPASTRTQHEVTARGSLLGGHEDNLVPPAGGDVFAPHPSGYTAFGEATLSYAMRSATRSLEASGGAYMNTYRNIGIGPRYGGEQKLRGRTFLGRRTEIALGEEVRYAPQFSLGLFEAVQSDLGRSNSENPTNALTESGSWTTAGSASVDRQWTRRTSTDGMYAFNRQRYVNGDGFDSRSQSGTLGVKHTFGRTAALRATYQHSDGQFEERKGGIVPIVSRTADVGLTYQRRLSATRELSFSAGSGASHVTTVEQTGEPANYVTPSGFGGVRFDFGRSWSLSGDYRRSITVLQGRTPQPFTADTAQISVGGDVRRWLESVVSIGYGTGVSGLISQTQTAGRYDAYTGTIQLRLRMQGGWSSIVGLTHFQYHLNSQVSEALDVARDLQRNAVRVGLVWALPLYNSTK